MHFLSSINRIFHEALGYRFVDISEDLPHRLTVRYGKKFTTFDKKTARIEQNGKLIAMIDGIERIELYQILDSEKLPNWYIDLQVESKKTIAVGQITDELDASIMAARISRLIGCPVALNESPKRLL